jgi:hypothetical protein
MGKFVDDLAKAFPEEKSPEPAKASDPVGVSLAEMKSYFEAMKESMIAELKKEISETKQITEPAPAPDPAENTTNNKEE